MRSPSVSGASGSGLGLGFRASTQNALRAFGPHADGSSSARAYGGCGAERASCRPQSVSSAMCAMRLAGPRPAAVCVCCAVGASFGNEMDDSGETGGPFRSRTVHTEYTKDKIEYVYREINIGEDERELRPPSSKAHPRSFPYPRAPNLGPQREPRGQYCYVLGFGASSPPASDGPPPSASPWSPTAPPWRAAAPSVRAPMGGRALPLSRAVPLSPLQ